MGKDFKGVYNLYDKSFVSFAANRKATDDDIIPWRIFRARRSTSSST